MENNENRNEGVLPGENSRQIQLVLNHSQTEEEAVNLGNVFHNMALKKRVFAWVLVLCLTLGICAPLLLYQFSKPQLTVSSVVILRYDLTTKTGTTKKLTDLTAPDGTALDPNQITSAYVLQTALDGLTLSKPISVSALRSNIRIQTILTNESQRTREALSGLAEIKNVEAYNRLQTAEMKYQNRFIVTLTNGFGSENSSSKKELTGAELRLLLDRILTVYNDYLVRTYADVALPDDTFSLIDIRELDVPDSLDLLRAGVRDLYDYCDGKPDSVKAYRSWRTGMTLEDWMETLETFRSINIDYLYSMVSENAVTKDKASLVTGWKYMLRSAQNQLDEVNENIAETQKILLSYKNNEVIISMQESDAAKSTQAVTTYYNSLVLQQIDNYERAALLKTAIAEYEDRIRRLEAMQETEVTEAVEEELARSVSSAQEMYRGIREHMEEIYSSSMYTTYEDHSAAQGSEQNFLAASAKKMIIGGAAGAIIGCGLWFLAALLPELSKNKKATEARKEEAAE